jgi:hypothetical protein
MNDMDQGAVRGSRAAAPELIEGAHGPGPRVIPVAVAPAARLRSPIMERRPIELRTTDDDRPSVLLPPMRSFIGPSGVALMVAAPILLLAGWQVALVAGLGAAGYRELDRRIGRAGFSLGDGFLPYRRETGWPHGVREDDDVRWNWLPVRDGEASRDGHPARG